MIGKAFLCLVFTLAFYPHITLHKRKIFSIHYYTMTSEFNDVVVTGIDVSEDSKKGKVALGISTNSSGNIMLHATL